jgi:hypothetical protein
MLGEREREIDTDDTAGQRAKIPVDGVIWFRKSVAARMVA